jgi:hypothetical protein
MWEMEGRSAKEIARELGVKETSVRHTVSRARASLKRILSEIVLDESRGLTALDMLSTTYRKSAELTKNSSKIALSVALLFFAVLGFSSMSIVGQNSSNILNDYETLQLDNQIGGSPGYNTEEHSASSSSIVSQNRIPAKKQNDKNLDIPGLDESGLPVGFTISDSKGGVGVAYFRERDPLRSDAALRGRQIIKTESGAANIFISQSLNLDGSKPFYDPVVSFGRDGRWVPLSVKVVSTDFERQESGDYLLTASIQVESAISSPIDIVATAGGRDLVLAPKLVVTRLLLDPSKTRVLAQTVYVDDGGVSA